LTFERDNVAAVWSPDGRRVAFSSRDVSELYVKSVDGGSEELLLKRDNQPWAYSWSPDGLLALGESDPTTGLDIWIMPLETHGEPQPFLVTPFGEDAPIFSPDGRWLAYTSNESGQYEVYVQPYPGPGRRWTISTEGGEAPVWSSDGRELFYVRARQMWAVTIETEPEFRAGTPRLLFEGPYELSTRHPHYDVLPDGRFIMLEQESERTTFNIILNWVEELKS
jgi:Tol biopolymer transport system component